MKTLLLIISCIISAHSIAQKNADTLTEVWRNIHFYNVSNVSNDKLIIFLHGGIKNPYFKQSYDQISIGYLIEGNNSFLAQAANNNFDLLIPIVNDSLNWLNQPEKAFTILKNYIELMPKHYKEIYISGFSDGGTGSFKIFYTNPDYFNGLIVFNGYPQHLNFNRKIDYSLITNKKIVFFSTFRDKNIPYEFLLTEYCKQKKENAETYFYLAKGKHSFKSYDKEDLDELFLILNNKVKNTRTEPIQGFVKNDKPIAIYQFRKSIVRKYNYGKEIYEENVLQNKKYKN